MHNIAGNEIWLHPEAGPGGYQIFYNLFNDIGGRARVTGAVLTPDGKIELPDRRLYRVGEKVLVATVTVDSDWQCNGSMKCLRSADFPHGLHSP